MCFAALPENTMPRPLHRKDVILSGGLSIIKLVPGDVWDANDVQIDIGHDVLANAPEGAAYHGDTPRHAGASDADAGRSSEKLFAIAYGLKAGRCERVSPVEIFFDQQILVGQEFQCRLVQL